MNSTNFEVEDEANEYFAFGAPVDTDPAEPSANSASTADTAPALNSPPALGSTFALNSTPCSNPSNSTLSGLPALPSSESPASFESCAS